MKFKIFMMLITLGIVSITPMIYMGKFDPMAFIGSGLKTGESAFEKLEAKAPKNITNVTTDEKVQFYRWRDAHGVMQFSNTRPLAGGAEKIELKPNENVVQAVKVPLETVAEKDVVKSEAPSSYSVKGMKKVMDDARGVEELLRKSNEDRLKMLNNL